MGNTSEMARLHDERVAAESLELGCVPDGVPADGDVHDACARPHGSGKGSRSVHVTDHKARKI